MCSLVSMENLSKPFSEKEGLCPKNTRELFEDHSCKANRLKRDAHYKDIDESNLILQ